MMKTPDTSSRVETPEALAAARAVYPDARRARLTRSVRDAAKDLIGQTIAVGGKPARILRARVQDIGRMHDGGADAGEMGHQVDLIVSWAAAQE